MDSGSSGYFSENSNESTLGLSKEMIDEEKKLAEETEMKETELKSKNSTLSKSEVEEFQQKLMVLLNKTTHYSNFIMSKLQNHKQHQASALSEESNKDLHRKKRRKTQENIEISDTYVNELGFRVSKRQPELLTGAVMRDYQLSGMEWLIALYENGINGLLADEMGLGKTIQVIGLICHLFSKQIFGPYLIISPLSTLPNWMLEFSNFAPKISVVLYHGQEKTRNSLKVNFTKQLRSGDERLPVVLTSYELALRDKGFFRKVNWCYVIVDEGHRLKNYRSMLSRELRTYNTGNRLILSGTPLQNNLTELWSLLNFLVPEVFNNINVFESFLDSTDLEDAEKQNRIIEKEKEEQIIAKMHQVLAPFLLRRMKCDVNIVLPRKKELLVYTPLTPTQEDLYKAVLENDIEKYVKPQKSSDESPEIKGKRKRRSCAKKDTSYVYSDNADDFNGSKNISIEDESSTEELSFWCDFKMRNVSMQLRKIVNHPYLVQMPINSVTKQPIIDEELINKSGKLLVLDAMLRKLKERGHKVLLFSTFTSLLDLVEEYLIMRKFKYLRLDGRFQIDDRVSSIKEFNSNPDIFVFLISTRAGGLGINLTAADTVIIYDSDWNPQVDLQAQDRCHRIGQVRPVVVYRLVTAGSVDQKIVERAAGKRRLEKLVVQKGKFKQTGKNDAITVSELKELLQSTDYHKVVQSNGLILSEEELEELLDRNDLLDNEDHIEENKENSLFKVINTDANIP